ncbi:DUF1491 family protein [bacterium]|nr:DUF1491 family protein [bacterium]
MRDVPTGLWVAALIRRAELQGAFALVAARGDAERGDAVVKVVQAGGLARVYVRAPGWGEEDCFDALPEDGPAPEADIEALVQRRREQDRDLWVVEIEDVGGRHFLTEQVKDKRPRGPLEGEGR